MYNIPTFTIQRPSKIYTNLDFWFENISSGNPDFFGRVAARVNTISCVVGRFFDESAPQAVRPDCFGNIAQNWTESIIFFHVFLNPNVIDLTRNYQKLVPMEVTFWK
jgi:hypothetical protein